jgi:hypothetical protein
MSILKAVVAYLISLLASKNSNEYHCHHKLKSSDFHCAIFSYTITWYHPITHLFHFTLCFRDRPAVSIVAN